MKTVLLVDDTETSIAMLEIALANVPDLRLEVARNGREALRWLDLHGTPSAVITDLNYPDPDGFDLIAHLHRPPFTPAPPIVVVSGDAEPGTRARVLALGADAFFPKPFSPALLRETLERLLCTEESDAK